MNYRQKTMDSLQTFEDLKRFIKSSKTTHYSEIRKGSMWLMASGRVAHCIGTELIGDRSFLFKYVGTDELCITYPGLPGVKDTPVVDYEFIQAYYKNNIEKFEKKIRKDTEILLKTL